jgi:hypothetical protein
MTLTATATDFYVGRGDNAEYLGTAAGRESSQAPELPMPLRVFQSLSEVEYSETDYRDAVSKQVGNDERRDPAPQWPHLYPDSSDTPWTVAYDNGTVYVYRFGVEVLQVRCNTHRWRRGPADAPPLRESRLVNIFPVMDRLEPQA